MIKYKWIEKPIDLKVVSKFEKEGINKTLGIILHNRKMDVKDYKNMTEKFWEMTTYLATEITGLNAAAKLLLRTLFDSNSSIRIFADYDTDGITSSAIINDFLSTIQEINSLKSEFQIYVPERSEGYGLSLNWCKNLIEEKQQHSENNYLVITFDNGITKNEEINLLRKFGIETIVTDHHEPDKTIPNGIVVDPKKDDARLGEELCGAGIAWLLVYQMYRIYLENVNNDKEGKLAKSLQRCLGYATIGTIGDMMPMTVYNMSLVINGLNYINNVSKNDNPSPLNNLIDCYNVKELTSKDIGFNISAAINACGQMGDVQKALKMFTEEDCLENIDYAKEVCSLCNYSRDETKKAKNKINKDLEAGFFDNHLFCIYVIENIPHGIAGKLSNHISSYTNKPTIVLVDDGTNELKGSGRCTNPTIDMLKTLKPLETKGLIQKAAGHQAACGVVFYKDKLEEAQKELDSKILEAIENMECTMVPEKNLYIDGVIGVADINLKNYKTLSMLPYSMNFYAPNFCLKGYIVSARSSQSNANNICYKIKDLITSDVIEIWVWNIKAEEYYKTNPTEISIVGNLVRNFINPNQITLDVVDLKFSI